MKHIKTVRREVGDLGESLACRYLESKGFSVLERNYLRKCGEIDIIVTDSQNNIRFIEVKSKNVVISGFMGNNVKHETDSSGVRPEDNIHERKVRSLIRIIQLYLLEKRVSPETRWQFDAVIVYLDRITQKSHIRHLENIIL